MPTAVESVAAQDAPSLAKIISHVVDLWPEHEKFLTGSLAGLDSRALRGTEEIAGLVWKLVEPEMADVVASYRWVCRRLLDEELYFRRHGCYRYASVREVEESGFYDSEDIHHYHRGLLLSQVLWRNHADVSQVYVRDFLSRCAAGSRLLEVGPGHGLFLALAARHATQALTGWDISPGSLHYTRRNLAEMGVHGVDLALHNIQDGVLGNDGFDRVVASELLEHVDDPGEVLRSLTGVMRPGAEIFINVPVNSPAPDHIRLWNTPDDFFGFVSSNGIIPTKTYAFPMSGYSEQRALDARVTISCVVIGEVK
ncbi:class I SAM-dependent methyltransferase [Streptomyces durmitorensis]|uniref:Class I SAM-dependent methyltransferase n=1 Tax=Streptomyces durmitorensis TaxID=319947 RepID=A0ABY4PPK3_9ACTN|nr:class I SAM-dependent methyltransferase [Streptomyces durmitorensis]UQT55733.1 class I SAM-dependent methyltransferase [Streptomyces durmitorensis]